MIAYLRGLLILCLSQCGVLITTTQFYIRTAAGIKYVHRFQLLVRKIGATRVMLTPEGLYVHRYDQISDDKEKPYAR